MTEKTEAAKVTDAVLIDDDIIVQMTWKMVAKKKGKVLEVFSDPNGFLEKIAEWDKAMPIYIDSNLGEGVRGEEVAKRLYDDGFTQLFLCTGYPASQFSELGWLQGVLGKDPPW